MKLSLPTTMRSVCACCALAVAMASCASPQQEQATMPPPDVPRGLQERSAYDPGSRPISQALPLMTRMQAEVPTLISRQTLVADAAPEGIEPTIANGAASEMIPVKLSTNAAPPAEVLRVLFTYLGQDYVLEPDATAKKPEISISVNQEMTRAEIRDLLDGIAMLYGLIFEQRGDIVYVRGSDAMNANPDTPIIRARAAFPGQSPVMRVRPLRYLEPQKAIELLGSAKNSGGGLGLLSEGGRVAAIGRTLLILDTERQADRTARVLAALDVPIFDGVEIWTYRLAERTPDEAVRLLTSLGSAAGLGSGASNPIAEFIPVTGTNNLMVVSRDPTAHRIVRDLISLIDVAPEAEQPRKYVYRLQHWDTTKLLNLAKGAFAGRILENNSPPGTSGVRITPDQAESLFLIEATPSEYAELLSVFQLVDRPRQQVVINSIIAEVLLTNRLEFGVEYFLSAFQIDGLGMLELAGTPGLVTGASGSAVFTGADGFAVIQALESETDVNVLSQPSLTARDGDNAEFSVGGEVPFVSGDQDTETGGLRRNIDYRDTGISLTMTPQINESGQVLLDIRQEIRDVVSQGDLGPEFTSRVLQTKVIVPHGMTVILGGFIETTIDKSVTKIPVLGDIPVLGLAFQSITDVTERRELILAVTPRIINEPRLINAETEEFLVATEGLRSSLYTRAEGLPRGALDFRPADPPEILWSEELIEPAKPERRAPPALPREIEELMPELREQLDRERGAPVGMLVPTLRPMVHAAAAIMHTMTAHSGSE
jgi:general secretion pathway protein D